MIEHTQQLELEEHHKSVDKLLDHYIQKCKEVKANMVRQEINPEIWTPKEDGDVIEGTLIKSEGDVGANKSMMYTLETKDSKIINVWGSTILDSRMGAVKLGEYVWITYKGLGEKKPGQNAPKIFKVEVDREEDLKDTEVIDLTKTVDTAKLG